MLFQCWVSVEDGGPTIKQHWVNASCLLRLSPANTIRCHIVGSMLCQRSDGGPTLNQHWDNVLFLLGGRDSDQRLFMSRRDVVLMLVLSGGFRGGAKNPKTPGAPPFFRSWILHWFLPLSGAGLEELAWLTDLTTLPPIHYLISSPSWRRYTINLTP